ncbi:MAG: 3'-5' exonuclease [Proteobacteria bacterium]|nr:MAG: 3'-5' exonuclease [Pseudomonadota bacterium]QKK11317.1 MAG: 3'-5' exonuclease [Pseudomonadota bacterium]
MGLWKSLFGLDKRRRRLLRKVPKGPLRNYYEIPFPDPDSDWRHVSYLPIDLETTGLNPKKEEILSVGYAAIHGQRLCLSESAHYLTRPSRDIPESSAVVHGIMDDEASGAASLEEALPHMLRALAGKVMVAHYAVIETGFLSEACQRIYGFPLIGPVVDTLELDARILRQTGRIPKQGELRLAALRERYGLPRYPAHNALIDAIAAGELFLAQAAYRSEGKPFPLKRLLAN